MSGIYQNLGDKELSKRTNSNGSSLTNPTNLNESERTLATTYTMETCQIQRQQCGITTPTSVRTSLTEGRSQHTTGQLVTCKSGSV